MSDERNHHTTNQEVLEAISEYYFNIIPSMVLLALILLSQSSYSEQ